MLIGFISDLHIKGEDGSKKFLMNDKEFSSFIKDLLTKVDILYLNGDVLELWKSKWFSLKSYKKEYEKTIDEYPESMSLILHDKRIKCISGNHDALVHKLSKYYKDLRAFKTDDILPCKYDGFIKIYHGQMDIWNKNYPFLGHFFSWIAGHFERLIFRTSIHYIGFAKRVKKPFFKNSTQIDYFKKLIDLNDDIYCVVNGHTHHAQIIRFEYKDKERLFINTGYFNGFNKDVTIIDTKDLSVKSYTVRESDFFSLKKKLLPGDVLLTYNTENSLSKVISLVSSSNYSHAAVYLGKNLVIESTIGSQNGVQISSIDKYIGGKHNIKVLRMIEQNKVQDFLKYVNSQLGIRYSFLQLFVFLFYLPLRKLGYDISKNIDITPSEVVCFELVAQGLMFVGYNIKPEKTTALDLESRKDIYTTIDFICIEGEDG